METNHCCTRTGRTISEKTMEDGNVANAKDDKIACGSLASLYSERGGKSTSNGHESSGERSSPPGAAAVKRASASAAAGVPGDTPLDDKFGKRINPLRIHLGKRPSVDNSISYNSACKKRKSFVTRPSDPSATKHPPPRVPMLIPKRVDRTQFHNAASHHVNEQDKPVPRLVPKSQLPQYKKGKVEKGSQLKEYAQSLGLQPKVKFKCRKCCSMSFKTLAMLKEHQLVCRAQAKEPALSPEAAPCADPSSGPSRVTRKVYLCSACGTYYENWNLFLHMREVHNRHICLFCLGMFSKAEKLSSHLSNKHNVQEFNYATKEDFFKVYNGTLYLMCCACDEICSEQDDFFNHDCNNVKPKPVPVLVSKNTVKPNNVKHVKNVEQAVNGPTIGKDMPRTISDKKEFCPVRPEPLTLQPLKNWLHTTHYENSHSERSPDNAPCKDSDLPLDTDYSNRKSNISPVHSANTNMETKTSCLPNGDDSLDPSEESDAELPDNPSPPMDRLSIKSEESCSQSSEGGGIKLKLSLNNANSPVIINSTVDPTVGQQYANKPPSRMRRPPKRYEKTTPTNRSVQVKPPTIKMTICDKADSPFVKTTIYENNKETTLINNNLESESKTFETKSENIIKTTIYDNKLEEVNTLNRVPKLTVRVPKEFLDKDSSSDYSSDSDTSEKLTVDDQKDVTAVDETDTTKEEDITPEEVEKSILSPEEQAEPEDPEPEAIKKEPDTEPKEELQTPDESITPKAELKTEPQEQNASAELDVEEPVVTDECEIPVTELTLDRPLDKYPLKDLLKVFLGSTVFSCIYCNHARKIAVNCEQLALHMVSQHRFSATVDSITAEELMPETITAKVRVGAEELCSVYINLDTYDSVDKCEDVQYSHIFECFQCYFKTAVHKDLYLHNRKMHQKKILLCVMCKNNFYSYSELLCHLCPGTYDSDYEINFRCCFCNVDSISSSFRLMVHLRKIHHTCDVCLELCQSQARLSNHVWKHKLNHLCYRCGISYRNKPDITNHLFWKHGTESVLCKKCLQKKWPHVYHFCIPPAIFACDECSLQFTRAVYLKVHKRFHSEEYPHVCTEEECTEKFVSKKLLSKHIDEHKKKLASTDLIEEPTTVSNGNSGEGTKESIPIIDLADDKPKEEAGTSEVKPEAEIETPSKKSKKKKLKDKDALLLDINLPTLNLSESDSSDESDSGAPSSIKDERSQDNAFEVKEESKTDENDMKETATVEADGPITKFEEEKPESTEYEKPNEQQVLDIWDNFKKYQAKVEKQKEKTPPLVPIRKHVCESDHDYCLIPTDLNGDDDMFSLDKKKNKKSPKKKHGDLSSSSSSSSDSDSSCCSASNCSCSLSSGSSSSSSSDSDSSDDSLNEKKKSKHQKKSLPSRRISNGSNVDVMGMSETPVLVPEKSEPLIAETDLDTEESETDEEFYDKNPQRITSKLNDEKKNHLNLLASVAPSDAGSISEEVSRCTTPVKEEKKEEEKQTEEEPEMKEKTSSSKKKSKKKKKSKSSRKHGPIKINIPKEVIAKSEEVPPPLAPNKITISLQSNTVQIPEAPKPVVLTNASKPMSSVESKRASKRRRVPNKFYGYSSDEEGPQNITAALKPQQPPKLEWRKEDLPSPVTHKAKKEVPSTVIPQRLYNYTEPIRLTAPIPDPEPPRILMNTESMESSDSDSSGEGPLEIFQPNTVQNSYPVPPPTYLNSGTSSLPYAFQRPAVRQAREGESVYCYCRCPYDEVSEMIACDAEGCSIEWFHFECVGIMVPPKGKWYCPECRKNQSFSGYR